MGLYKGYIRVIFRVFSLRVSTFKGLKEKPLKGPLGLKRGLRPLVGLGLGV